MSRILINLILFQTGWLSCVISAAHSMAYIGGSMVILIMIYHLTNASDWRKEALLLTIAMLLGLVWDSFLVVQNWLTYSHGQLNPLIAPYWIVLMWGLFATTLNVSLNWLKPHWVIALLFGAIGGPLAYIGGAGFGAVEINDSFTTLIILALGWAVLTPLLLLIADILNGTHPEHARSA